MPAVVDILQPLLPPEADRRCTPGAVTHTRFTGTPLDMLPRFKRHQRKVTLSYATDGIYYQKDTSHAPHAH